MPANVLCGIIITNRQNGGGEADAVVYDAASAKAVNRFTVAGQIQCGAAVHGHIAVTRAVGNDVRAPSARVPAEMVVSPV